MNRLLVGLFGLRRVLCASAVRGQVSFVDATQDVGLPWMNSARLTFVDLNGDGRADIVARVKPAGGGAETYRAFLNHQDKSARFGFRFDEMTDPHLPAPIGGD